MFVFQVSVYDTCPDDTATAVQLANNQDPTCATTVWNQPERGTLWISIEAADGLNGKMYPPSHN